MAFNYQEKLDANCETDCVFVDFGDDPSKINCHFWSNKICMQFYLIFGFLFFKHYVLKD